MDKYGRLTVLNSFNSGPPFWRTSWQCVCDCGTIVVALRSNIVRGKTISCGCYHREATGIAHFKHGETKTRLYQIWGAMLSRCRNPKNQKYGGRGIEVCAAWEDYQIFRDWAMKNGYASNLTIERKNNDGNYDPSNCCWIPPNHQALNRRTSRKITAFGETKTLAEWKRDTRCQSKTHLERRLNRGIPPERAILEPKHINKYR